VKLKKVLVVDDEDDIILFLQTALDDAGYRALTASSAASAFDLIRREKPDLVCLDILMPGESGMSLFQRIRSDADLKDIPILITTGMSLTSQLNGLDYCTLPDGTELRRPEGVAEKPVTAEQFVSNVEAIFANGDKQSD
jgi:CheY-like chemotaxis protein